MDIVFPILRQEGEQLGISINHGTEVFYQNIQVVAETILFRTKPNFNFKQMKKCVIYILAKNG